MIPLRSFWIGAAVVVMTTPAQAQRSSPAPLEARNLVVKVETYFGRSPEFGSGILVGFDNERVYIVTAKHVVRQAGPATRVLVSLAEREKEQIEATVSDSAREDLDLAVISIPRSSVPRLPALDRLGKPNKLRFGDAVSPMGCPAGECWRVPAPADRVSGLDRQGITFQTGFVEHGSSGGALFNQYWEVVGMVTRERRPRAEALPIDAVLDYVREWKYPVSLKTAKVPRSGYSIHVGASLLTRISATSDSLGAMNRFPSGRIVATRRGELYGLTWHVSGLRLAPRNLAVTAAMGGAGVDFQWGRFTAQPFLEIGIGRVEGRYDAGGYFVAGTAGPTYVPFWQQQKQDGLGFGGGMSILTTVAPHITIELLVGHWSFNVPDSVPNLPNVFIGSGLRWGL